MMTRDSLVCRTLVGMARQRRGFDAERTRAVLDLACAGGAVKHEVRAALAPLALTELQFAVLIALLGLDPVPGSPAAIADHTGVTRPSITDALDQLEKRGLLARTRSREDRRAWFIVLTSAGRELAERATPLVLKALGTFSRALEKDTLRSVGNACAVLLSTDSSATNDARPASA